MSPEKSQWKMPQYKYSIVFVSIYEEVSNIQLVLKIAITVLKKLLFNLNFKKKEKNSTPFNIIGAIQSCIQEAVKHSCTFCENSRLF